MSRDTYLMGYASGRACAYDCPNSIREHKFRKHLGELAGRKLENTKKKIGIKDNSLIFTPDWSIGFWDGFMDTAEIL